MTASRAGAAGDESAARYFLVADCGSTATKVILVGPAPDGRFGLLASAAAPTTVEQPVADVVGGILSAAERVAGDVPRPLLDRGGLRLIRPASAEAGVDRLLACSSAAGGLQLVVVGVVGSLTVASAARAALGAGAIVTEVLAYDDTLSPSERVACLRRLRPDMILLSGGTDGGSRDQVVSLATSIADADPRPRFGETGRLPVIYAGNRDARPEVASLLRDKVDLYPVANLRPTLDDERMEPVRRQIHAVFMDHVMSRAPGYGRLVGMCDGAVRPTPAAVGAAVRLLAAERRDPVVAVDVVGATTDVYSVQDGVFRRTVSANLGLSFSLPNLCREVGWDRLLRWFPYPADPVMLRRLRNAALNKMVRPGTLPAVMWDLCFEQAAAREAIALAFAQHRRAAAPVGEASPGSTLDRTFRRGDSEPGEGTGLRAGLIVGAGGVLSRAPRRIQAAMVLIDALQPVGLTELALDPAGVLAPVGVLAEEVPGVARDLLAQEAVIPLGVCLAPLDLSSGPERTLARCSFVTAGGSREAILTAGVLQRVELPAGSAVELTVQPEPDVDCGEGPGRLVSRRVEAGLVGLILDGRGRPLAFPPSPDKRVARLRSWQAAVDLYPEMRW